MYVAAKRICFAHHDDLAQHLLLILLEMPESKLQQVQDYIQLFCIKIMSNQWRGKYQNFRKLYADRTDIDIYNLEFTQSKLKDSLLTNDFDVTEAIIDNNIFESRQNAIENTMNENHWYEREIMRRWMEGNSARQIHRDTQISVREVLRVIKYMKEQMNNKL